MTGFGLFIIIILAFVFILFVSAIKILNEWERAVVLRLGRIAGGERGPGLILLIPFIDKMRKVDTRLLTMQVPPQEIITRDNVSVKVTAVVNFRVIDCIRAITQVVDYMYTTSQQSQTALRSILGQHSLDELLASRDKVNDQLQMVIDGQTEPYGVKVGVVEIKDVEIPVDMQRAMAKEAEAERERRAKIINAEGEFQAAEQLTNAADRMSSNPVALQLRYLQTVLEIGANNNTTTLFPIPIDLLEAFRDRAASGLAGTPAAAPSIQINNAPPATTPPPPA
ncbi:MAG: slipin family protein [Thermoleophilia bacterium]|nr:slipin family protein [Thermoleophilia bacterium]